MQRKRLLVLPCLAVLLALATVSLVWRVPATAHAAVAVSGLHVSGNQLLNSSGQVVRLVGVNRSSAEYSCNSGGTTNVFDDPNNLSDIPAMLSWSINVVRIPLNEDCWLGINGEPSASYTAAYYQQQITSYVNQLTADNLIVILDLHWNNSGSNQANSQEPMPDLDHAPAFWTSVANAFKSNSSVIFDLYNEPYTTSWDCWLNGAPAANTSPCIGLGFAAVGMQALVNTVRATGATNPIMLGGLAYSNDISQWLQYRPSDPLNNLIASVHIYNFNACSTATCWDAQIAPVAAQVPVIAGEIGENDCAHGFIDTLMNWFDQHGSSYLAWAWNPYNCATGPSLISDFSGTPTAYGAGYKAHLLALGLGSGTPTGTPTPTVGITPTVGTTPTATPTVGITPTPTVRTTPTAGITPTPTPASGSACNVHYAITNQWPGGFGATITITNTGTSAINGWSLHFTFANGQTITQLWNGAYTQTGSAVTITSLSYNGSLAPGATLNSAPGFNGAWNGTNAVPTSFTLNGVTCSAS
ncbi:MAG TPA: cellulose binding domain-containing protein [Ktedonobacteraceae bacterium]|nr:cellulose binding domain-containing protein [Ktedonobacteraceae bacterium]